MWSIYIYLPYPASLVSRRKCVSGERAASSAMMSLKPTGDVGTGLVGGPLSLLAFTCWTGVVTLRGSALSEVLGTGLPGSAGGTAEVSFWGPIPGKSICI